MAIDGRTVGVGPYFLQEYATHRVDRDEERSADERTNGGAFTFELCLLPLPTPTPLHVNRRMLTLRPRPRRVAADGKSLDDGEVCINHSSVSIV